MGDLKDSSDSAQRRGLIKTLCDKLRRHYVFADRAELMCQALLRWQDDAAFLAPSTGHARAEALTAQLLAVCPDRHLRVRWFAQMPAQSGADAQARRDEQRRAAEADHHGIHRVERLPGRIGLLEVREFHHPEWSGEAAAAARAPVCCPTLPAPPRRRCASRIEWRSSNC